MLSHANATTVDWDGSTGLAWNKNCFLKFVKKELMFRHSYFFKDWRLSGYKDGEAVFSPHRELSPQVKFGNALGMNCEKATNVDDIKNGLTIFSGSMTITCRISVIKIISLCHQK
jgi:hypothetical protein